MYPPQDNAERHGKMMKLKKQLSTGIGYAKYVIFHPFKGIWDLKAEKIGNLPTAFVFIAALILVNILRRQMTGYILNMNIIKELNIFTEISMVVVPFLLWCISNWSITTLMDGEGSFQDIFITTAYALVPIIILNIPMLIISNIITIEEAPFYTLLDSFSIIWFVFILVIGIMTIHQFSFSKTLGTILIAVIGMLIIVCLAMLFFALIQQIVNFIWLVYNEVSLR